MKNAKIRELGSSISTTNSKSSKTIYSFIEFDDGTIFRDVEINHVLDSKLIAAFKDSSSMKLHFVYDPKTPNSPDIIAIKGHDGRLYAQDINYTTHVRPYVMYYWYFIIAGIVLTPLLIGIPIIIFALWFRSSVTPIKELAKYIHSLPNAILIT